jgi:hypothetical protein
MTAAAISALPADFAIIPDAKRRSSAALSFCRSLNWSSTASAFSTLPTPHHIHVAGEKYFYKFHRNRSNGFLARHQCS